MYKTYKISKKGLKTIVLVIVYKIFNSNLRLKSTLAYGKKSSFFNFEFIPWDPFDLFDFISWYK